jgi:hypothetical protein
LRYRFWGGGGGNPQTLDEPEEVWLTEEANPFLGEWSAYIPSAGATYEFKYETNGTVEVSYQGQTSTGAYIVADGYQVTYLDSDGGIGAYTYKVIDNNTISVTEGEFDEDNNGAFTAGATTLFNRKPNTDNFKNAVPFDPSTDRRMTVLSKPFNADNNITGVWAAALPPEGSMPASQTIQAYDMFGNMVLYGVYPSLGMSQSIISRYSAVGDVFVIFMAYGDGGGAEAYQYATETDGSRTVTPITSVNQSGARALATEKTTPFTPVALPPIP